MSGTIKQLLNIVLPFVIRTIVLYVLGSEYQGLSGLFTSILNVLNLTELGFSTAVMFVLYRPIAEKNKEQICAIVAYLKKIYKYVGLTILTIGLIILPFLRFLISGEVTADINIYLLYLIYLANTVISYWMFAYKSVFISAMQREDIVSNIATATTVTIRVLQIILLLLFKNYYIYILVQPIGTAVNNMLIQYFSKKYYPEIMASGEIQPGTKKVLSKQIGAIFIGKAGDVARNAFDDIIISAFIGLTAVTIYDNYYYIYAAIYAFLCMIVRAMQASVGDSMVTETKERNYSDLNKFTFIFMWIVGWCSASLCSLYQPFMDIWMRNDPGMMLSNTDMLLFCVYFYAINMNNSRNLYITGGGLYPYCKKWFAIEALGNLALNIVLGKLFGITGVIIATIVTIFLFNFIARTNVLFRRYFERGSRQFYFLHLLYFLVTILVCAVTYSICSMVITGGALGFAMKMAICLVVPNLLYLLVYSRTKQFHEAYDLIRSIRFGRHGS